MTDQPHSNPKKTWHALVLGRAGLDLYPNPDGGKTRNAHGFSADMGGSGGNIAVAMVVNEMLEPIRLPFVIATTKPVVDKYRKFMK